MKEPVWVLPGVVRAAHEQLLAQFGGPPGIRDEALLASALEKPRNLFVYEQPDHFRLAASYAFGIINNHPFIDGNKRTGFLVAVVFLELNGYTFIAREVDAALQTLALAAGELTETAFASWLKTNVNQ